LLKVEGDIMDFTWPRELSEKDKHDIIHLMNTVAVRETTLGFHEELSMEAGMALMQDFDDEIRRGRVEFLAVRAKDGTSSKCAGAPWIRRTVDRSCWTAGRTPSTGSVR
jgi:hypothetical protein